MKKIISLFVAICLLAGLMSGCSFKRISAEEDIINMQAGGYLYTSKTRADTKAERDFLKQRSKAVDSMMGFIEKAAKHAYDLTGGLEKYENNLIKYIKKVEDTEREYTDITAAIVEKITAYKVLLESREEIIRAYMDMNPDSDASVAIINTYMLNEVCQLIETQNEYITWLSANTASVCSILEKTTINQNDKLLSSSSSIYGNKIENNLVKLIEAFETASLLNSAIESADYYVSELYLDNTASNIALIKSPDNDITALGEDLSKLEELYENARSGLEIPQVLLPLPEFSASFSLTRRVSAEDNDPNDFQLFSDMLDFYITLPEHQISSEVRNRITASVFEEKTEEILEEVKADPYKASAKIIEKQPGTVPLSDNAKNTTANAVKAEIERAKMLFLIKLGQKVIQGMVLFGAETEQVYASVINQISQLMVKTNEPANYDNMTEIQIKKAEEERKKSEDAKTQAMALIKNEMEILIGEHKQDFINAIVSQTATELYETFMTWKDSIDDFKNHTFTKEDLLDLLLVMGVKLEEIDTNDSDVQNPTTDGSDPTHSPQVSPSATESADPTPSSNATEPVDSTDSSEIVENFGISAIAASWEIMRTINPMNSNENILSIIYGWGDNLDYSDYKKTEIKNKENKIIKIYYSDDNDYKVGWETSYGDESIIYTYHFPDDNDHEIEIYRNIIPSGSYLYEVKTEDETTDRNTAVRFYYSEQPSTEENIKYIIQKVGGIRNGLNTTSYNSNRTYSMFNLGKPLEEHTFKNNILIHEATYSYEGDDIIEHIKNFYDNGKPWNEFTEINGKKHGTFTTYHKETGEVSTIEYKNGTVVK